MSRRRRAAQLDYCHIGGQHRADRSNATRPNRQHKAGGVQAQHKAELVFRSGRAVDRQILTYSAVEDGQRRDGVGREMVVAVEGQAKARSMRTSWHAIVMPPALRPKVPGSRGNSLPPTTTCANCQTTPTTPTRAYITNTAAKTRTTAVTRRKVGSSVLPAQRLQPSSVLGRGNSPGEEDVSGRIRI